MGCSLKEHVEILNIFPKRAPKLGLFFQVLILKRDDSTAASLQVSEDKPLGKDTFLNDSTAAPV